MQRFSSYRKYLSVLIIAVSVIFFSVYFINNKELFEPLTEINPIFLVLLAAANVVSLLLNGIFIKVVLVPFRKSISVTESFYVSLISSVGNYFAPAGAGLGFRAVYLKRKHGLSYGDFMATVSGNYVLVFFVTSLAGIISLVILRTHSGPKYWLLFSVFTALFLMTLILMSVKIAKIIIKILQRINVAAFVVRTMSKIIEGWLLIITNRGLIRRLLGLTAIGFPLSIIMSYLTLQALHFDVSFGGILLLVSLSSLSIFINITPGNIGVKEAVYVFSAQAIGLSTPQILSYALVERGIVFLVLFAAWVFLHTKKEFTDSIYNTRPIAGKD